MNVLQIKKNERDLQDQRHETELQDKRHERELGIGDMEKSYELGDIKKINQTFKTRTVYLQITRFSCFVFICFHL